MSSAPYFNVWFSDFAGDTLDMSAEEVGAYFLLLGSMWNAKGYLRNEDDRIRRICRIPPKRWPKVWGRLQEFFTFSADGMTNERLLNQRIKYDRIVSLKRASGEAGAAAKSRKRLRVVPASA